MLRKIKIIFVTWTWKIVNNNILKDSILTPNEKFLTVET